MTPERDGVTGQSPALAIEPVVASATTTPVAIDVRDCRRAMIAIAVGAGGITFSATNKIELVLTHSVDGTTFDPVAPADVIPDPAFPLAVVGGVVRALTSAHADPTLAKFGYIGGRGWLKLQAKFSGTHGTGTGVCAIVNRTDLALAGQA